MNNTNYTKINNTNKRVTTHFKNCKKCGQPYKTPHKYARICEDCKEGDKK